MNDYALREIARERCAAIRRGIAGENPALRGVPRGASPTRKLRSLVARAVVAAGLGLADFGRALAGNEC
jgi:hypothetical protein